LTIKHIIAECPTYEHERLRLFPVVIGMSTEETMIEILSEKEGECFETNRLIQFIGCCGVYNEI